MAGLVQDKPNDKKQDVKQPVKKTIEKLVVKKTLTSKDKKLKREIEEEIGAPVTFMETEKETIGITGTGKTATAFKKHCSDKNLNRSKILVKIIAKFLNDAK